MQSIAVQQLIDLFENQPDHELSNEDWATLLSQISDEHKSKPAPYPVTFGSHAHRMQVYALRAADCCELFHPDDVQPPLENPADGWNDSDTPTNADESEGSPRAGAENSQLAA